MTRILLGAGASVAIYKACDAASKLTQAGHEVRCILTPSAALLISPQLFESVTGQPAASTEFGPERRGAMDHIDNARWAELALIAPASADLIGRLALGLGGDLLTTTILALPQSVPRLLCPAANPTMLANPAVERNLGRLREDGWEIVEPGEGHMACGEAGRGRLAEPEEIVAAVLRRLAP
jgi:phosphopantothenoylcysteine decarboxylase/phosphopantothenate--cysteine ligase